LLAGIEWQHYFPSFFSKDFNGAMVQLADQSHIEFQNLRGIVRALCHPQEPFERANPFICVYFTDYNSQVTLKLHHSFQELFALLPRFLWQPVPLEENVEQMLREFLIVRMESICFGLDFLSVGHLNDFEYLLLSHRFLPFDILHLKKSYFETSKVIFLIIPNTSCSSSPAFASRYFSARYTKCMLVPSSSVCTTWDLTSLYLILSVIVSIVWLSVWICFCKDAISFSSPF